MTHLDLSFLVHVLDQALFESMLLNVGVCAREAADFLVGSGPRCGERRSWWLSREAGMR